MNPSVRRTGAHSKARADERARTIRATALASRRRRRVHAASVDAARDSRRRRRVRVDPPSLSSVPVPCSSRGVWSIRPRAPLEALSPRARRRDDTKLRTRQFCF